jgi:inward rectifier potassium channel
MDTTRITRVGRPALARDLYGRALRASWWSLLLLVTLLYLLTNAIFAGLFLLFDGCIAGARPGSYIDAFFFSVQTLSTIGYGAMAPKGLAGNLLVAIEALVGLFGLALVTGITFARFARPKAGILFSQNALFCTRNGQRCLVFRVANARGGDVVQASLTATALMDEVTEEGHKMRRLHDLKLLRDQTPLFLMSWLVVHEIDESSPLYGKSLDDFQKEDIRLICAMTGLDGTFMQTVYAYRIYQPQQLLKNAEFEDVVAPREDGSFELDLARFHDTRSQ